MKLKLSVQKAIKSRDWDEMAQFGGGSDGFWYDLTYGGYFKPETVLADKEDIKKVKEAIKVLQKFEAIYDTLSGET